MFVDASIWCPCVALCLLVSRDLATFFDSSLWCLSFKALLAWELAIRQLIPASSNFQMLSKGHSYSCHWCCLQPMTTKSSQCFHLLKAECGLNNAMPMFRLKLRKPDATFFDITLSSTWFGRNMRSAAEWTMLWYWYFGALVVWYSGGALVLVLWWSSTGTLVLVLFTGNFCCCSYFVLSLA